MEQTGIFLPDCLFRLQVLKILCQPSPIELTIPKVCCEMSEPCSAQEATCQAHRVYTCLPCAIRKWRAVEHRGPYQALAISRQECDGPTGLTIAVQYGCLSGMAVRDLCNEAS